MGARCRSCCSSARSRCSRRRAARSSTSLGQNPPPADELDIRRVTFEPGEIQIRVTNPQRDAITIGSVTVDDAIVPYTVDGPTTLDRLRSATIVVPYDWVRGRADLGRRHELDGDRGDEGHPGRRRDAGRRRGERARLRADRLPRRRPADPARADLAAGDARRRPRAGSRRSWRSPPACSRSSRSTRSSEALALQATLPGQLGGTGLVLLGVAGELPRADVRLAAARAPRQDRRAASSRGVALATLVAIGIGLHNLGEGLAIGSSFALGELALGSFLIVGFMVHNVTEGLGIAAPIADGGRHRPRPARRPRARRRRADDRRRLDRRLPHERPARRPLLRGRGGRRAPGGRRGRPLRRAARAGRPALRLGRRRLPRRRRRHVPHRPADRLSRSMLAACGSTSCATPRPSPASPTSFAR